MGVSILIALLAVPSFAFQHGHMPLRSFARRTSSISMNCEDNQPFDPLNLAKSENTWARSPEITGSSMVTASALLLAPSAALLAAPSAAMAKGGEYGLAEGRIISLAHPTVMGICFLISLGAGYTGYQHRNIRSLQVEITALKASAKEQTATLKGFTKKIEESEEEDAETAMRVATLTTEISVTENNIKSLQDRRKELNSLDFRDKHFALGALLLGLGVSFAIEGPVNTYMRAGKLFPGPHLYAGAGCTALWALAASLVPQMQKGKDWARTGHISMNVLSTALFAYYQIPTGLGIAAKVIEKTKFP
mmetsp:Transcript_19266/g.26167  ORF Transcript_19266/g.26167 Transcript_19266/m.26167 type:complete len:306 (-) Transcript_19266:292-1209(-)